MIYVDNGSLRLGIDLNMGGSITYLAPADHPERNVINSADLGRQIQLSFYSGPVPYQPAGSQMSEAWKGLGWNPIQTGDYYGNPSKIIESRVSKNRLYVKCIPMHWPLRNVPGECQFEVWLELQGNTVQAHCRLTNKRNDLTQYSARGQELPAVYVNAPYHHLVTYDGPRPWSNDKTTEIRNRLDKENHWATWLATENWAAQVDDSDWGLGIWNPDTSRFSGGFCGEPGVGGPSDSPTGYIAPNRTEILDHDIVYDFRYVLILGNLPQIREYAYRHADRTHLPSWTFQNTRDGWSYENATDAGWPVRRGLEVKLGEGINRLVSPEFAAPTEDIRAVEVTASCTARLENLTLDWASSNTPLEHRMTIPWIDAAGPHTYRFPLRGTLPAKDVLTQLRLEVLSHQADAAVLHIAGIRLVK